MNIGAPTFTEDNGITRVEFSGTVDPLLNPSSFMVEETVGGSVYVEANQTGGGPVYTYSGKPVPKITRVQEMFPGDLEVQWEPVDGATEYRIYRSENMLTGYVLAETQPGDYILASDPTYDIGMGKTYWYAVEAVTPYGNLMSVPISITTAGGGEPLGAISATATDAQIAMKDNNMQPADGDVFVITLNNATVKEGISKTDLTIAGLPDFIDYSVTKSGVSQITVVPIGAAAVRISTPAVVNIVVKASAVTESGAVDAPQVNAAFTPYGWVGGGGGDPLPPDSTCGDTPIVPCATVSVVSGDGSASDELPEVKDSGLQQVKLNNKTPTVTDSVYDYTELPADSAGTTYKLSVDPGDFDPVILIGAGDVKEWSMKDGKAEIIVGPMPFSFDKDEVKDGDGHDRAEISYANAIQLAFDDGATLTAEQKELVRGMTIVTDAQSFSPPTYNEATKTVSIFISGPHHKQDGDVNIGQFKAFLPNNLLNNWGVTDPDQLSAALSSGSLSNKQVTAVPGGMLISFNVGYSEKTVSISANTDEENPTPVLTGLNVDTNLVQLRMVHNATKSVKVTAFYDDQSEKDVSADDGTTYTVEPADIATVNDGVVTARKAGQANVTVAHGEFSRSFIVTVAPSAEHIYGDFKFPSGVSYDGFRVRVYASATVPSNLGNTVSDATYGGTSTGIPITFFPRTAEGSDYMHTSLDVEPGTYSFLTQLSQLNFGR